MINSIRLPEIPKHFHFIAFAGSRCLIISKSEAMRLRAANLIQPRGAKGRKTRYKLVNGWQPYISSEGRIAFQRVTEGSVEPVFMNLNCFQLDRCAPAAANPASLIDPELAAAVTVGLER